METYYKLKKAAEEYAEEHVVPRMQQLLVCLTKDNRVSVFLNDLSPESEDRFLAGQKEPVAALLCYWHTGDIDVPSCRIRQGLLDLYTENGDASVYLRTGQYPNDLVVHPKKLSALK